MNAGVGDEGSSNRVTITTTCATETWRALMMMVQLFCAVNPDHDEFMGVIEHVVIAGLDCNSLVGNVNFLKPSDGISGNLCMVKINRLALFDLAPLRTPFLSHSYDFDRRVVIGF